MSRLLTRKAVRDALLGVVLVLAAISLVLWPQQSMEAAPYYSQPVLPLCPLKKNL